MDDLSPICELGSGTCGHVIKMRHNPTGYVMAVKVDVYLSLPIISLMHSLDTHFPYPLTKANEHIRYNRGK